MLTPVLFQRLDFQLRPVQFAFQIRNVCMWIEAAIEEMPRITRTRENVPEHV